MSIEFCNLFSWCQPADKLREAEAYSRQLGGFEGSGKYDRGYRDLSRLRQVSRVTSSELDRNVVKSTDLVESIHGAFFSTLMVELKGDLEAVHEQVSKQNQRKALCWGVSPSVCCCSEKAETDFTYQSVYRNGRCMFCLCCEPQFCWPCENRTSTGETYKTCCPFKLHCILCVCNFGCGQGSNLDTLLSSGRIDRDCCCEDLPTVGLYNQAAKTAVQQNVSAYLQMILHPHWDQSLPPGIAPPDSPLQPVHSLVEMSSARGFIAPSTLDFLAPLQQCWPEILQEFEHAIAVAPDRYFEWSETEGIYNAERGWRVFGLVAYGEPLPFNQKLCPLTTKLLQNIPNLT